MNDTPIFEILTFPFPLQLLKEQMDRTSVCPTETVDRQVENKLCDAWTDVLTQFMEEHFIEFSNNKGKCENGGQVERLVRKWAYVVRLADWCYHDGILSRYKYMLWVLNVFQGTVKDPQHQASWSAELMLPLIANVFPDLCKLRTEIPELIRVCVSRYMHELLSMQAVSKTPPSPGSNGGSALTGMLPPVNALLSNLRKLVQSLLVMYPEAYVSLYPEVQFAWRLIDTETSMRDISSLKLALRNDAASQVPCLWLHHAMPWVLCERKAKALTDESGAVSTSSLYTAFIDFSSHTFLSRWRFWFPRLACAKEWQIHLREKRGLDRAVCFLLFVLFIQMLENHFSKKIVFHQQTCANQRT